MRFPDWAHIHIWHYEPGINAWRCRCEREKRKTM